MDEQFGVDTSASDALMRVRDTQFGDAYDAVPIPGAPDSGSDPVELGFRWRTPTPG